MKNTYYHCEVYKYDEYDRNRIHEAVVNNISAYTARLDVEMPDWDEIEIRTESNPVGMLFGEAVESKLIGKLVNPSSRYVTMLIR